LPEQQPVEHDVQHLDYQPRQDNERRHGWAAAVAPGRLW
jgi:hypothetical protein